MKPRRLVYAELVARTEDKIAYRSLVGNRERKRPCLEGSRKWQDKVKRFLKEGGTRFLLTWNRDREQTVVMAVTNFRVS
jgi:hypothetical protein